jgi:hypothetical protein
MPQLLVVIFVSLDCVCGIGRLAGFQASARERRDLRLECSFWSLPL